MPKIIQLKDGNESLYPICGENGSNYVKLADGTLICHGVSHFVTSGATGVNTITVTFPLTFISSPTVIACWSDNASTDLLTHFSSLNVSRSNTSTTGFRAETYQTVSGVADSWYFKWIAIGHWK